MPLWTPAYSNPATSMWIDATDASTITLSGSNVAQINDKSASGANFSQSSSGSQPVRITSGGINNLPCLQFDGSSDILVGNVAAETLTQNIGALSIYSVFHTTGGNGTRRAVLYFSTNSSLSARAGLFVLPSPIRIETGGRRLDGNSYQTVAVAATTPCLGASIFDFANAAASVGIDAVYTARGGGFQTAGNTSNTASALASLGNGGGNIFGGTIGEVIVFKSVLALSARELIEGYLAHKWGLQTKLSSSHPYRLTPPMLPQTDTRRRRSSSGGFGL